MDVMMVKIAMTLQLPHDESELKTGCWYDQAYLLTLQNTFACQKLVWQSKVVKWAEFLDQVHLHDHHHLE